MHLDSLVKVRSHYTVTFLRKRFPVITVSVKTTFRGDTNIKNDKKADYCTSYELCFLFLSDTLLEVEHNRVELYEYVFYPDLPTLAFVGICTVLGSYIPVAEMQARWFAGMFAGRMPLPSNQEVHAE
jgi:dimethylaniline monooxygenase (N-oxide forming)